MPLLINDPCRTPIPLGFSPLGISERSKARLGGRLPCTAGQRAGCDRRKASHMPIIFTALQLIPWWGWLVLLLLVCTSYLV